MFNKQAATVSLLRKVAMFKLAQEAVEIDPIPEDIAKSLNVFEYNKIKGLVNDKLNTIKNLKKEISAAKDSLLPTVAGSGGIGAGIGATWGSLRNLGSIISDTKAAKGKAGVALALLKNILPSTLKGFGTGAAVGAADRAAGLYELSKATGKAKMPKMDEIFTLLKKD